VAAAAGGGAAAPQALPMTMPLAFGATLLSQALRPDAVIQRAGAGGLMGAALQNGMGAMQWLIVLFFVLCVAPPLVLNVLRAERPCARAGIRAGARGGPGQILRQLLCGCVFLQRRSGGSSGTCCQDSHRWQQKDRLIGLQAFADTTRQLGGSSAYRSYISCTERMCACGAGQPRHHRHISIIAHPPDSRAAA
jgi:hypothetical protein